MEGEKMKDGQKIIILVLCFFALCVVASEVNAQGGREGVPVNILGVGGGLCLEGEACEYLKPNFVLNVNPANTFSLTIFLGVVFGLILIIMYDRYVKPRMLIWGVQWRI